MTWPKLDIVIPTKSLSDPMLLDLIKSIDSQWYPKNRITYHIETKGNSEEAKAYGIAKCRGDIVALFCTDNLLTRKSFLARMVILASRPDVIGAYPAYYTHEKSDPALNRYFALIGANDPVCYALDKADRYDRIQHPYFGVQEFNNSIPSIGDNGFFIKRAAIQVVVKDPSKHFCIDAIEDLRKLGLSSYYIANLDIHHRTGNNLLDWVKRRYRYVAELYWRDYDKRRWKMVQTKQDWECIADFVVCSILIFPNLLLSWAGNERVPDKAWFLHPVVCLLLTLIYGWAWLIHRLPRLLFRRGNVRLT